MNVCSESVYVPVFSPLPPISTKYSIMIFAKHMFTSTPDYINETIVNLLNCLFAWTPVYINQTIVKFRIGITFSPVGINETILNLWIGCLRVLVLI